MTQEQLASAVGVSQQSVAKWESGKSIPRHRALIAITEILDLPPDLYRVASDTVRRVITHPAITSLGSEEDIEITEALMEPTDVPDVFPTFDASTRPSVYAKLCNDRIAAFLGHTNGRWISQEDRVPGRWEHTYGSAELMVEFMHAPSATTLSAALQHSVYRKLWRMLVARAYKKDKRSLLFIITLPHDAEMRPKDDRPRPTYPANDVLIHRLTTEAALLDISVFLARSPAQAAMIIGSYNSIENDSWE